MARDGRVHDIDIDHFIFYRKLYQTANARVSRGSITGTKLHVRLFALPGRRQARCLGSTATTVCARREELPKEHSIAAIQFTTLCSHKEGGKGERGVGCFSLAALSYFSLVQGRPKLGCPAADRKDGEGRGIVYLPENDPNTTLYL
ncbi:hypothetical protein EDB85DRAFT_2012377, partial [Lactarius pseudohatsudake]